MYKFNLIKQHDQKDCGVACLAMILNSYNSTIPLSKLRLMSGTNNQGTSAFGLVTALETLGFESELFQTDDSIWNELDSSFPLIAHVVIDKSFLHYVVVYGLSKGKLLIADPGKGKIKMTIKEFSNEWTEIVLTARPAEKYKPVKELANNLLSYTPLLVDNKRLIVKIILLSICLTGFGVGGSFYFQVIIDRIIPTKSFDFLTISSISFLLVYLFQSLFQYLKQYLSNMLGQRLSASIMLKYFQHVLNLPMTFFATRKSGEIISRFLDATKIIDALASATLSLFLDAVMVLIIGLILFLQNKYLFLISLATLPVYSIIVFAFMKPYEKANEEQMEVGAIVNSQIIESLKGIETIKSFNATNQVFEKIADQFNEMLTKSLKTANLENLQSNLKSALQLICSTILLWLGTFLVLKGQLTTGQLITYNALMFFFTTPLQNIINLQVKIQKAKVANDRLNEVFYLEKESFEIARYPVFEDVKRDRHIPIIEFSNVSFAYGFEDNVLNGITCSIQQNSKVAIVGMSGSGKSTLAKLMMNFYDIHQGEIAIRGDNIQTIARTELRESISYVSQEAFFFSGSIYENLTFGLKEEPTLEEVTWACEMAQIREYIEKLPFTYQSPIEEGANNLSGGQKQRMAIARALLKQSRILILDEATSGLDARSEHIITKNLMSMKNKTILFIVHHLSIAKECDQILVLENGRLVEAGTHHELRKFNGTYENLWEMMAIA
ncbi:peptide cleavage/export ABC transporter [Enterococcus raffinosus]|uniref:peptide cleavage/export ABC transporter n=1 Tax=Enterococcus raffinosus TaxID=71452 RepID=UPI001C11A04D|nr:peptide cleavage/export ABC transporter [Enterococcus raffinosus]MBU5362128.1 peptide cleavage/export ABC transporter [Enterococcus raffinosus]